MSLQDLDKAFELLEKVDNSLVDFEKGVSSSTIKDAEVVIRNKLPYTYTYFLKKYGCGGISSSEIYGLIKDEKFSQPIPFVTAPNVIWTALANHRDFNQPFHILSIYDIGNGDCYALDLSQMNDEGECPVVVWPIGGYEATRELEVVAPDFGKFFLDMVEEQIKRKEEAQTDDA